MSISFHAHRDSSHGKIHARPHEQNIKYNPLTSDNFYILRFSLLAQVHNYLMDEVISFSLHKFIFYLCV